jgi:peptidoglycan/xylan/chitin deacetylase (PgdA/CDA1 family)
MRLFRPSAIFRILYPEAIVRIGEERKTLCLTIDDGPHPGSTPAILRILERYGIGAVFFCTGQQAKTYPELVDEVKSHGHVIGNHGYYHLNGFSTSCKEYFEDALKADAFTSSELFRPPYGRMTPCQYNLIRKKYRIALWDLMVYDFDASFGPAKCLRIMKKSLHAGSVVVLHDNPRSCIIDILPEYIEFVREMGYVFGKSYF